jgi:anti-sigma factor RsiW
MKCVEVRKLVRPYLDSELDAKTSLEVEQHLESCAECAGLFEAEKEFDERLGKALSKGERTSALWQRIESQIKPGAAAVSRFNALTLQRFNAFKRLWPFAAAACAVLLIAALAWSKTRPLDLAVAVEHCHSAYVHQLTAPEFTGAVPDEVARKLGDRLDVAAFSFRPASATFSAQGARLCHLEEVPVALILGHFQGVPVSLIVLKKSELSHFPKTKRKLESGDPIACSRAGRYQFAARLVSGHVVCLIGDAPRPFLEDLLKTVSKQG